MQTGELRVNRQQKMDSTQRSHPVLFLVAETAGVSTRVRVVGIARDGTLGTDALSGTGGEVTGPDEPPSVRLKRVDEGDDAVVGVPAVVGFDESLGEAGGFGDIKRTRALDEADDEGVGVPAVVVGFDESLGEVGGFGVVGIKRTRAAEGQRAIQEPVVSRLRTVCRPASANAGT